MNMSTTVVDARIKILRVLYQTGSFGGFEVADRFINYILVHKPTMTSCAISMTVTNYSDTVVEVDEPPRINSRLHQRLEERRRALTNLINWGLVRLSPRFYNTIDFPFSRQSCQLSTRNISPIRDFIIKFLSAHLSILRIMAALILTPDLVLVEIDRRRQRQCYIFTRPRSEQVPLVRGRSGACARWTRHGTTASRVDGVAAAPPRCHRGEAS